MRHLNIQATNVLVRNLRSKKRIKVNQGGTRSSKTWSIAQILACVRAFEMTGEVFTIVRKTFPALRATAMRDFFDVLNKYDLYKPENHDKTNHIYTLNGNEIEFVSVDQPQKIRGRKRKILWPNETNELSLEDWRQLMLRTTGEVFLDYNPSDEFHWIYDEVLVRDDVELIKSTYLDNTFLDVTTIKEIERLKEIDENYWRIYGLGERGVSGTTIYTNWQHCDELPADGERIYGLDFGFNHPTALIEVVLKDGNVFARERLYESFLTNSDLIPRMKELNLGDSYIYADTEDPNRIMELKRAGFNIKDADKAAGSVKAGITLIKGRLVYLTKDSVNADKERKSYKWKEKDGKALDEPVKLNDDLMDALRYAVYTHLHKPKARGYATKPVGL